MKLEVYCPNCGAWKRTHDVGDAPEVKKQVMLVQRQKAAAFSREAQAKGLKVRGTRPGKFPVAQEELGAEAEELLKGWGRRMLAYGFDSEVVHCACGGVIRYALDDADPLGVRLVDETPTDRRRPGPPARMRGGSP